MSSQNYKRVWACLSGRNRTPVFAMAAAAAFTSVATAFAFQDGGEKNSTIEYTCSNGDRAATYSLTNNQRVSMEFRQAGEETIPFTTLREEVPPYAAADLIDLWCFKDRNVPKLMEIKTPEQQRAMEAQIESLRQRRASSAPTNGSVFSFLNRFPW